MLHLYVIILEVVLKNMTSLGDKKSSMPLKMHQQWSFFIITSFIHEREIGNKDSAFHVSQDSLFLVGFRDFSKLCFSL